MTRANFTQCLYEKRCPRKTGSKLDLSVWRLRRILQTQYIKPTDGGSQEDCLIIVLCSLMFSIMLEFLGGLLGETGLCNSSCPSLPPSQPTPEPKCLYAEKLFPPSDLPVLVCSVPALKGGRGVLPIIDYTGRLHPKGIPF